MQITEFTKIDVIALLDRRLRSRLGKQLVELLILREDPVEPETMRFPVTLVAVLTSNDFADQVTEIISDVNLESDFVFPAFAYVITSQEYTESRSLKARIAKKGVRL